MPTPRPDESRKDFVSRCIPIVIDEGTAKDADQAAAICNSMWEKERSSLMSEVLSFSTAKPIQYKRDSRRLIGYAAVFHRDGDEGTEYRPFEGHREIINRNAFDGAIERGDDVYATFNHDNNNLLARLSAGTLRLAVDDVGLKYEIDLPDTTIGRDVGISAERGDLQGSSFQFIIDDRRITRDESGNTTQEILSVNPLIELGPVTNPAFTGTSVSARSAEHIREEITNYWKKLKHQEREVRMEQLTLSLSMNRK